MERDTGVNRSSAYKKRRRKRQNKNFVIIFQNCGRKCPVNWSYVSDSTYGTKVEQENARCAGVVVVLHENTDLKSLA
jgi:hypothetical protein